MAHMFLVESNGTLMRKPREDLQPDDEVVFDGPDAFESTDALKRELMREIAEAGGLDAWRSKQRAATR